MARGRSPYALTVILTCLVCCSPDVAEEEKGALPTDAITIEASAVTRQELGVAYWALERQGTGDFNGYDEAFHVRVTFQRATQARDGATLYAFGVADGEGVRQVVFARDAASSELTLVNSTLEGPYQRIVELLAVDLETMPRASSSSNSPSLTTTTANSLKPLAPPDCGEVCLTKTRTCVQLVDECNVAIANYHEQQPKVASSCPLALDQDELNTRCFYDTRDGIYPSFLECRTRLRDRCYDAYAKMVDWEEEAKYCSAQQDLKDCRQWLGFDPLPPVK